MEPKTTLVSGSTTANLDYFNKYYKERIDQAINEKCFFMIGGAKGIDQLTQQYLIDSKYPLDKITVVDKKDQDNRLSDQINHKNGFKSYPERDQWMTENSDQDIATVNQYAGGGSGTFSNLVRRKYGPDVAKGIQKLFRDNATEFVEPNFVEGFFKKLIININDLHPNQSVSIG